MTEEFGSKIDEHFVNVMKDCYDDIIKDVEEYDIDFLKNEFLKVADELMNRGIKLDELIEHLKKGKRTN